MKLLGAWLSLFERLQRRSWATRLATAGVKSPIFIVGHWRSGTTYLHELLCADPGFAYPTTHACMNPQHFLWSSAGAIQMSSRSLARPMDGVVIRPGSPQEDEFALLCLGSPSPYDAALYPQSLPGLLERTEPARLDPVERAAWESRFLDFLSGVSLLGGGRPLVLKSPAHSLRIASLAHLLPDARFIHIVRDPVTVYASSLRMWRELMAAYGVGAPIEQTELRRSVRRIMVGLDNSVVEAVAAFAPRQYQRIRYEDLVSDPVATIARLYRTLDLGSFEQVDERIAAAIEQRRGHRVAGSALEAPEREALAAECGILFDRYGYAPPAEREGA
jgi:hypothetical protein